MDAAFFCSLFKTPHKIQFIETVSVVSKRSSRLNSAGKLNHRAWLGFGRERGKTAGIAAALRRS
jgi:hypothetical protein